MQNTVTAYNSSQIAYPIGRHRDSYSLKSYFTQNIETNEITVTHKVVRNWSSPVKNVELFEGTAKECLEFIESTVNTVFETEGVWHTDERHNQTFIEANHSL